MISKYGKSSNCIVKRMLENFPPIKMGAEFDAVFILNEDGTASEAAPVAPEDVFRVYNSARLSSLERREKEEEEARLREREERRRQSKAYRMKQARNSSLGFRRPQGKLEGAFDSSDSSPKDVNKTKNQAPVQLHRLKDRRRPESAMQMHPNIEFHSVYFGFRPELEYISHPFVPSHPPLSSRRRKTVSRSQQYMETDQRVKLIKSRLSSTRTLHLEPPSANAHALLIGGIEQFK